MGIPVMVGRAILGQVLEKPAQKVIVKMLGGNPAFLDTKTTSKKEASEDEPDKQSAPEDDRNAYKKGGKVSSASKRADGIAKRGKTKGRMV